MRFNKECTISDLEAALREVNKKYKDNIIFNRLDQDGFTLKCKDSKKVGHRIGAPLRDWHTGDIIREGRRLINACWHVHGDFFDALFKINPKAIITARGKKITKDYGNWEDSNIGSQMYFFYHSDACGCE